MSIKFDHVISYLNTKDHEEFFKQFELAGFPLSPKPLNQQFGLQSRFLFYGKEYIEYIRVIDDKSFEQGKKTQGAIANASEWIFNNKAERVISLNFVSQNIKHLRSQLVNHGYRLPDLISLSPKGVENPQWLYQMFGNSYTPGVFTNALTYLNSHTRDVYKLNKAKNSTYAIHESIFVSPDPKQRVNAWKDFLSPNRSVQEYENEFSFTLGNHRFSWIKNDHYNDLFKEIWKPDSFSNSEYALTCLYAEDLNLCQELMDNTKLKYKIVTIKNETGLLVLKSPYDGHSFLITEKPMKNYIQERTVKTGEMFTI